MKGFRPYELYNIDSEDAPPWAIAEIVKFSPDEGFIRIRKPTANSLYEVMCVGGGGVKAGKRNVGFSPFDGGPFMLRYKLADGTPAMGQDWGTESGQWTLKKGKIGFIAWDIDPALAIADVHLFQLKVCNAG